MALFCEKESIPIGQRCGLDANPIKMGQSGSKQHGVWWLLIIFVLIDFMIEMWLIASQTGTRERERIHCFLGQQTMNPETVFHILQTLPLPLPLTVSWLGERYEGNPKVFLTLVNNDLPAKKKVLKLFCCFLIVKNHFKFISNYIGLFQIIEPSWLEREREREKFRIEKDHPKHWFLCLV